MGGDLVCRLGQFGRNRSIVSGWGGRTLPLISFRMAGRVGRIDVFDDSVESWCSYTERLDQYFLANEVTEEKKVPALLSLIGSRTYGLLRNLTAPALPAGPASYVYLRSACHYFTEPFVTKADCNC